MKIQDIIRVIEKYAPRSLQESYDNAGVQVGNTSQELTSSVICLDVTEKVIDEAIEKGANLILSHHPLIFKGLKSITGSTYIERILIKAIQHGICIYAAHTNLDNAWEGVNTWIAKKLGLTRISILDPKQESLVKLVTFVPLAKAQQVREALFQAGAGEIGNYDSCSFNSEGFGTFRAGEGADPYCGKVGSLHEESEVRIEVILPAYNKLRVQQALCAAHPYEEPAYDWIPVLNDWQRAGSGVVGTLPEAMDELDFLKWVKSEFGCEQIRFSQIRGKKISRVALCGGSASFLIPNAISAGADVYLTGEIKYHDYFGNDEKILLVDLGHYQSEQFTMGLFDKLIKEEYPTFVSYQTEVNTNPINYL